MTWTEKDGPLMPTADEVEAQTAGNLWRATTETHTAMRLPNDSAARKNVPMFSGLLAYFPDALADVARLSKAANDKHNPGQPLHWSRGKSDDHADCLVRHQVDAGRIDDDPSMPGATFLHDTKVAWRALAQLQLEIERRRAAGEDY